MTSNDAIEAVKSGFKAIANNEMGELAAAFSRDAAFFVNHNPYRIDDLETFRSANESFFQAGGRISNFDIRQPRVLELSENVHCVMFHYSQRVEMGGISIGSNGQGTAIIVSDGRTPRIAHLHTTQNVETGGILPSQGVSATDVLAAVERIGGGSRALLVKGQWGCE